MKKLFIIFVGLIISACGPESEDECIQWPIPEEERQVCAVSAEPAAFILDEELVEVHLCPPHHACVPVCVDLICFGECVPDQDKVCQ